MEKQMKAIITTILILGLTVSLVNAGELEFGAGVVYDGHEPGLTVEKTLKHHKLLGIAIFSEGLHMDYLIHNEHLLQFESFNLPVFYGAGVATHWSEHHGETEYHYALRLPFGTSYYTMHHHLESFLELVPTANLGDHTELELNWAAGVRYHF